MAQYVAFLRAVNVGRRRVDMGRLRDELEGLGYERVSTFVNSGNAVFATTGRRAGLEATIEGCLAEAFGFEVPTFVRSAREVAALAAADPFGPVAAGHTHLVAMLRRGLPPSVRAAVEALSNDVDTLVADGPDVHWLIRGRSMASTLTPKDWAAAGAAPSTTRNVTMLRRLADRLDV